jgi:2-dehydropantoate 2-reductase
MRDRVRTLFVGAGATGGYFGGRLVQAGRDVTFLVRPARAAALAERGLRIKSPGGESVIDVRTVTADAIDGNYDLVVLAVKSYTLEGAIADVTPAIGPDTVIVPLLNGMRHMDRLRAAFGDHRVWGGLAMIFATLDDAGDVVQLAALERIAYGPLDGGPDPRADSVAEALSGAEFDSDLSATIVPDMWEKWVLLASLGAATTLMRATVGDINAAPGGPAFAEGIVGEAVALATAASHAPRDGAVALLRASISSTAPLASSMYRDMVRGLPVEADEIVGDLVAYGDKNGVTAPLMSAAYTNLAIYAARRGT